MQFYEIMLSNFIFANMSSLQDSFKNGNNYMDVLIKLLFLLLAFVFNNEYFSSFLYRYFKFYMYDKDKNINKITFTSKKGAQTTSFRALLYYLSKDPRKKNINSLLEDLNCKYNKWGDFCDSNVNRPYEITKSQILYRVNQSDEFKFNDNIFGKIYTEEAKSNENNGNIKYEEMVNLKIYSKKLVINELQEFVRDCVDEYRKDIKQYSLTVQSLITVENKKSNSSSKKKKDFDDEESENNNLIIRKKDWSSYKTFDNLFFPGIKDIVKEIDFFINNSEWYKEKGIPWTLGILLSGIPGSGKTSFIKALMNYTKRHCVDIKLDDTFKISELGEIISDEQIDENIIIPIDNRIIVLEDIDCMGELVKDRDKKETDEDIKLNSELIKHVLKDKVPINAIDLLKKESDNNLSRLLSLLDGLDEHSGRILIMTTNKPEDLDPALIRPGRIDIRKHFDNATLESTREIIEHFWKIKLEDSDDLVLPEKFNKFFSPAQIISFCRSSKNFIETIELMDSKIEEIKNSSKEI